MDVLDTLAVEFGFKCHEKGYNLERTLAEYRKLMEPLPPEPCPEPRHESDEYVCGRCLLRWDTHEDKPPCPKH